MLALITSLGLRIKIVFAQPFGPMSLPTPETIAERWPMRISDTGIELIQEFEGLRLVAYRCPAGVPTIGFGHTKTARMGMRISMESAEYLLREDLDTFERCVDRMVSVPLNSNEFSALVSWAFNVGCGAVAKSTLIRKLNAGDRAGAADELLRWNKAGGKVLAGLTRRRRAERELFLRPQA